ncbi:EamA family transporter [Microlunatus sp. Y2014]|uniref:EamA family transporter n=1 Tax=Microlunatus sp. Y2014 TaxID=3418488 RepID=UPI003DA73027
MLRGQSAGGIGIGIALASAGSFAVSGSFAKGLLDAGWSPGAAVTMRIVGAALVLLVPALLLLRGGMPTIRRAAWPVIGFGAFGVAGSQLCYFMALSHLPVSVALLLEYSAPVLLVGWLWARTRRFPGGWVLAGAAVAVVGLIFVLDPTGAQLHPAGIAWGLGAAVCNAAYFVVAARVVDGVGPVVIAAAGVGVAGVMMAVVAAIGILPMAATFGVVQLGGREVPWWVAGLALIMVSTVSAYLLGIVAVRRLGTQVASFVALSEVALAVVAAWALRGEVPTAVQAVGGAVLLAGVIAVRVGSTAVDAKAVRHLEALSPGSLSVEPLALLESPSPGQSADDGSPTDGGSDGPLPGTSKGAAPVPVAGS